jgi:hypothetical protein
MLMAVCDVALVLEEMRIRRAPVVNTSGREIR